MRPRSPPPWRCVSSGEAVTRRVGKRAWVLTVRPVMTIGSGDKDQMICKTAKFALTFGRLDHMITVNWGALGLLRSNVSGSWRMVASEP